MGVVSDVRGLDRWSTSRDHHVRAGMAPVTPVGACRKLHIEQSLQKIEIHFSVTCEFDKIVKSTLN